MQLGAVRLAAIPTFSSQASNFHGEGRYEIFSPVAPTKHSSKLVIRSVYPSDPYPPRVPRQGVPREEKPVQEEFTTAPPAPIPYYGVPVKETPPPARILTPKKPPPKFTKAEPSPVISQTKGLGLGIPELDLPDASPRRKYERPYEPAKTSNERVLGWLRPPPPPYELTQREQFVLSSTCTMTIYLGDITKWRVDGTSDAIVAPANKKLFPGAAVDGAIHKAAGPRLFSACQRLPDVGKEGVKCEVGNALSTEAFDIPVARIIHAVGPVYEGRASDDDLEKTYLSALSLAAKEGIKHIAFPALSCRIYGYPYQEGARIALKTLKENCQGFTQIDIVLRHLEGYNAFIDEASDFLEVVKTPIGAASVSATPPQAANNSAQGANGYPNGYAHEANGFAQPFPNGFP